MRREAMPPMGGGGPQLLPSVAKAYSLATTTPLSAILSDEDVWDGWVEWDEYQPLVEAYTAWCWELDLNGGSFPLELAAAMWAIRK